MSIVKQKALKLSHKHDETLEKEAVKIYYLFGQTHPTCHIGSKTRNRHFFSTTRNRLLAFQNIEIDLIPNIQ
jgi:hypothetical protein